MKENIVTKNHDIKLILFALGTVIFFLFITLANKSEPLAPAIYSVNWSDHKDGLITSIKSIKIHKTENIDGGYNRELELSYNIENTSNTPSTSNLDTGKLVIDSIQTNPIIEENNKINGELLPGAMKNGKVKYHLDESIKLKNLDKVRLSWVYITGDTPEEQRQDINLLLKSKTH
jgi:hypothetical protein